MENIGEIGGEKKKRKWQGQRKADDFDATCGGYSFSSCPPGAINSDPKWEKSK